MIGSRWIFKEKRDDVGLEWVVVRQLSGDMLLLVPMSQTPWCGVPDVSIQIDEHQAPWVVHCGESMWYDATDLKTYGFAVEQVVSSAPVRIIRRMLAQLARGTYDPTPSQLEIDADPEYETWMSLVREERVHQSLLVDA